MILEHLRDRITGRAKKGEKRSPQWSRFRKRHLKREPWCMVCGAHKQLQAHHIIPFQYAPDLELEPSNVITLCTGGRFRSLNCHLIVGHLGSFEQTNEAVRSDAAEWAVKLRAREYRCLT